MLARRCVGNGVARQLIVNGKPLNAPRLYQHPAHSHLLMNVGRAQGWGCAICHFAQVDGGEQRQRFHCEQDCQLDVCADCMGSEYSAWHSHRDRFVRGEAIVFSGLRYMGHVAVTPDWPDAANQERLLELIDAARRAGDLPWRAKEHRALHLFSSHINITSDPNNMLEWERYMEAKVFSRIPAGELATVTCLNDDPVFIVALTGPAIGCHFLECVTLEAAEGVCDTVQRAYDSVFQSAVLDCVDDSIQSAVEGRAPKYAPAERQVLSAPAAAAAPIASRLVESDSDDEERPAGQAAPLASPEVQATMIASYLSQMSRVLGQPEVMQFAGLLRNYRLQPDFATFSKGLLGLFGDHSKELLPGIHPFLPLEHRPAFEELLASLPA